MKKFKVGDKVTRNITSALGILQKGVVYTVQELKDYDGRIVLEESNDGGWDQNKFTLAEPRVDKEFEDLWV